LANSGMRMWLTINFKNRVHKILNWVKNFALRNSCEFLSGLSTWRLLSQWVLRSTSFR